MNRTETPSPAEKSEDKDPSAGGPTAPSTSGERPREAPKPGDDDRADDRTSSNRKGGYGAG